MNSDGPNYEYDNDSEYLKKRRQVRRERMLRRQRAIRRRIILLAAAVLLLACGIPAAIHFSGKRAERKEQEALLAAEEQQRAEAEAQAQEEQLRQQEEAQAQEAAEAAREAEEQARIAQYQPQETEATQEIPLSNENVNSTQAILVNADTGEIVARKDDQRVISPASMTKILTLLVAGLCYYVTLHIVWSTTGIWPKPTYNSLLNMGKITESPLADHLAKTWLFFFQYLSRPSTLNSRPSGVIHLLLGVYILAQTAVLVRKKRLSGKAVALLLLLIVLFPLGGNCVFLLSNGLKHTLMIYSFVFFDVWALMLCDIARENKESQAESSTASVSESKVSLKEYVVPVLCGMLILNRVLFANALYLNVDLLNRATLSFMTRMVDRMERTPGYKIGETPVIIVGHIRENPYVRPLKDFGRLHSDFLGGHGLDVTFPETYKNYFDYVLNYPVQYVPREEMAECLENLDLEAIHNMPIFPEQGGVALIDGVLVVKLSENIEVTEDADW